MYRKQSERFAGVETVRIVAQTAKEKDRSKNVEGGGESTFCAREEESRGREKEKGVRTGGKRKKRRMGETERIAGRETEVGDGGERSSSGRSRWCGR